MRPRLTTGLPFSPAHRKCACRPTSLPIGDRFATILEVVGVFIRHFSCFANPERSSRIHRCSLGYWWGGSSLLSSSFSFRELLGGFSWATLLCCSIHPSVRGRNLSSHLEIPPAPCLKVRRFGHGERRREAREKVAVVLASFASHALRAHEALGRPHARPGFLEVLHRLFKNGVFMCHGRSIRVGILRWVEGVSFGVSQPSLYF